VLVFAVREQLDRWHSGVRREDESLAVACARRELERRVLVVQRVMVAAGEQGPHAQLDAVGGSHEPPAGERHRRSVSHQDLVLELEPIADPVAPGGPGLGRERRDPGRSVRVHDVGRVALTRERDVTARGLQPDFEPVHQHLAPGGRRRRGEQQRVIAAGPAAADGAGGEPAEAVGLEPLAQVERVRHDYSSSMRSA
jgi:hypothetical protein